MREESEESRDVCIEKSKMSLFQPLYSFNEMLTVKEKDGSKCMNPELVNCGFCGSCAIQHPQPSVNREQDSFFFFFGWGRDNQFGTKSDCSHTSCLWTSFQYKSEREKKKQFLYNL